MIVKCLACSEIYDKKEDNEKCCDHCVCQKYCPKCGSNSWVPLNKNESKEDKKQVLLCD